MVDTVSLNPRQVLPPPEPSSRSGDDDQRQPQTPQTPQTPQMLAARELQTQQARVDAVRERHAPPAEATGNRVKDFAEFSPDAVADRSANSTAALMTQRALGLAKFQRVAAGLGQASSVVQAMDDANDQVSRRVSQIKKIVRESREPGMSDRKRSSLHDRFSALRHEINEVVRDAKVGGVNVSDHRGEPRAEVGDEPRRAPEPLPEARPPEPVKDKRPPPPAPVPNTTDLDLDDIDLRGHDDSDRSQRRVDDAAHRVERGRERLAAMRAELTSTAAALKDGLDSGISDTAEARRRVQEVAEVIRSQPSFAALATRNGSPVGVLNLLVG